MTNINRRTALRLSWVLFLGLLESRAKAWKQNELGAAFPFRNISLTWEERVDDLVNRLTLGEMVNLMKNGGPNPPNPAIPRLGIPPYNFNTECMRGVNKPSRATAFPQSIGLGSTFSPDLMTMMAEVISTEARGINNDAKARGDYSDEKGINCYSPMINILRHPLWGRRQEGYGEDPFLVGAFVAAYVEGLQGNHPRYVRASAGCKHFAVHSGPENIPSSRFNFNSVVSERDFRLTFMPQFKQCIEAGSLNIMCSYNRINGVPACCNQRLLTEIGRQEYGFKGFYVSDADALGRIYTAHHYANSTLEAAVLAVNSGVDLELASGPVYGQLYDAVKKGLVSMETMRERKKKKVPTATLR